MPIDDAFRLLDAQATVAVIDERSPRYVKKAARGILITLRGEAFRRHLATTRLRPSPAMRPIRAGELLQRALHVALVDGCPIAQRNKALRCAAAAMIGVAPNLELAEKLAEALELGELPGCDVEPLRGMAQAWGRMRGPVGRVIREACRAGRGRNGFELDEQVGV